MQDILNNLSFFVQNDDINSASKITIKTNIKVMYNLFFIIEKQLVRTLIQTNATISNINKKTFLFFIKYIYASEFIYINCLQS